MTKKRKIHITMDIDPRIGKFVKASADREADITSPSNDEPGLTLISH
jgi:hypothetical protein